MLKLYLTGVHCVDCVNDLIEGILLNMKGVTKASFDDKDLAVDISFDRDLVSEEEIREVILGVGYSFRNPEETEVRRISQGRYNLFLISIIILALLILVYWFRSL